MNEQPTKPDQTRRGVVIAVALLVVMVLGLTVAGSIRPLSQETDLASLRVETARAFYAAESGVTVYIAGINAGLTPPEPGETTATGSSSFSFIETGETDGRVTVEGRSGSATRRLTVIVE